MLAKWSTRMSVSREVDRRATVVELMENVSSEQTDIYTKKSISWILNDSGNSNRCQTSCMLHLGASQTPDAFDTPDTVSGIHATDGLRESGGCARGVLARAEAAGAGTKLRSIATRRTPGR